MTNTRTLLCAAILAATSSAASAGDTFTNPVIRRSAPDPTVIRADDGHFYLYSTEDTPNTPIYRSDNLVDWTLIGTAFSDTSRPSWNPKGGIWAPDINKIGDKYVLYYSKSEWMGLKDAGVGVATADRPEGPFTDHGCIVSYHNTGVWCSIDPFFIEDEGRKYLIWGSYWDTFGIELTADGLSVKPGAEKVHIASNFMEGSYVFKRGRYYYLFGSNGSCCEGANSTYRIVCSRSENVLGPYYSKEGIRTCDGGFSEVLHGNDFVAGPGHNAEIVVDDEGTTWMPLHGYEREAPEKGRQVWLVRIDWRDGWPVVDGGTLKKTQPRPVFGPLHQADPTIFCDNGKYYLYGTQPGADAGFLAYESDDLMHWRGPVGRRDGGYALRGETYGSHGFWAPQVFSHDGRYYMAYTANEHIAIATATRPEGPFTQPKDSTRRVQTPTKAIDPFVFFDTDGKAYLYHVRVDGGNRICVAEMNPDLLSVKSETVNECIQADQPWENTARSATPIAEGPTVVKVGKLYYMFYSANDFRSKDYAVGVATAPSPLGPWKKHPEPLISTRNTGLPGTGHGDLFKDKEGRWQYVFHAHYSDTQVQPRRTAIVQLRLKGTRFELVPGTMHFVTRE